jgi:nucleoside-diphosphate-sugar epimerase
MMNQTGYIVYFYVCVIICLRLSCIYGNPSAEKHDVKTILVFGGNGFIGSATVEKLLRGNYSVVVINRGNWYWDTEETVKPFVKHVKCDRMQSLQRCAGLQHYIWSLEAPPLFEAVIDFSAYHAFEISEALTILKDKIKKYIYISSDSVYEVCEKHHHGLTREEDAVRPTETAERNIFKQKDDYGNRKLECEEELEKQATSGTGIPYISLRLPDVVGPRDNTYRWWIYQLWIRLADFTDKRLAVPKYLWNQPMSLVYVYDVADVISDCITSGEDIYNNAYNLALTETPTLVQLLHGVMNSLEVEDVDIIENSEEEGFHLFPSVKLGPLDTTKARRLLNWNPTSWIDVLDHTVHFYEEAILEKKFDVARKDVIRTIQQYFSHDSAKIMRGLKHEYGLTFDFAHDEL